MSTASNPVRVAVLDDYLQTSKPHFSHIPPATASITTFTDTIPPSQKNALIERLKPFDVISTMRERTPFSSDFLRSLPNLKLLLVTGTQFQCFALDTLKELEIPVAASKGQGRTDRPDKPPSSRDIKKGNAHSTTQHTWALILALARNVAQDDFVVKHGGWHSRLATNLLGKTLGIVGLGRLGAATARIGVLAWGMKIRCWSANLTQEKADEWCKEAGLPLETVDGEKTFKVVRKDELFVESDVVSIHYVLSARSIGFIGKADLDLMKPSALLVNTSRGPLIDQEALLDTLQKGRINGAAIDVFDIEPLPQDSPWRSQKWGTEGRSRVLTTPHMGYVEEELINCWYEEQAENLERWLAGKELLNRLV
jgi:phosphoglycerate dehydrogenase-like enzyme